MAQLPRFNVPDVVDEEGYELVRCDPDTGKSLWMRPHSDGVNADFKEIVQLDSYFRANSESRSETFGKRWGEGQIAASVPMSLAFSNGYMDAVREGDTKWIKRFLNDGDNAKFRTKEGTL